MPESPNTPKISVIVPVYRAEKHLAACVSSILAQTYRNFELLLVDDGSPDDCPTICDEFTAKHARVRVLHKENEGVSLARNSGVAAASGVYIAFVDADDRLLPDTLERLYDALTAENATISVCGMRPVSPGETPPTPAPGKRLLLTAEQALETMLYQKLFFTSPWAKLLPIEIVRAHPFPPHTRYEDMATTYLFLADASAVAVDTTPCYLYTQHAESFMGEAFSPARFTQLSVSEEVCRFIEARYPAILPAARARHFAVCCQVLLQTPKDEAYRKQRESMLTSMRVNAPLVYRDTRCRRKDRAAAAAFSLAGESGLRLLWKLANGR